MFDVKVDYTDVLAKVDSIGPHMHDALLPAITSDAASILNQARSLASGGAVQEKTGKYLRSIKSQVYDKKTKVYGVVRSRDPRAPLFEWGGATSARNILPNAARVMAFMGSAGQVFAKIVHRPVVNYPPHPVITAAFQSQRGKVASDIQEAGFAAVLDIV